ETILATAPVGLGVLDRELRFVRVNEALVRGNGVPRERHLGYRIDDVWLEIPAELLAQLRRLLDTGEAVIDDEPATDRDGGPRYVLGSYYPVRGQAGEVLGRGVGVLAITERKLAGAARR